MAMTVDDMKALLSEELEQRVTWLLDLTGKPIKETHEIYSALPPANYSGIITVISGSQFKFKLSKKGDGDWLFEATKLTKNLG